MNPVLPNQQTGPAVPNTGATNPISGLVHGLGGTTGQATSDVGGTGGHLLSNVANTVGNTLKGAGNTTASHGGPLGAATGGILGGTGSAVGATGNAAGGLTSKVANAVGGAVNALSGNAPLGSQAPFGIQQAPFGQAPLGTNLMGTSGMPLHSSHHTGTSGLPLHSSHHTGSSHMTDVAREIRVEPTVLVEKVEKPVIVKETILPQEKIEVQPFIHREREQLEVHQVVQPLHERDIAATSVRQATLPAEMRAEIRESDTAFQTTYREATTRHIPEVRTEAVQREFVNRPSIVEERVHKKIVEEIQPVLYKETVTPVIIEETQPIFEKIVEAPRIVEEMRPMVDLGTRYASEVPTTHMSNLSLGGQHFPHKETTITKESWIEPGTSHMRDGLPLAGQPQMSSTLPLGGQPLKETTITQDTFVEPARATSHPHTHTKRII